MQPNEQFGRLPSDDTIEKTSTALQKNGFAVFVVPNGAAARQKALETIPAGAEILTNTSTTVLTIGLAAELDESGRFDSIRKKEGEMRKLRSAPDWAVGSVHAVTQNGEVMIASQSGSQLAGYAFSAGHVVFLVGAQKIVKNLEEGRRRIYEYCLPLEDERARQAYGTGSSVNKILILNKEPKAGRTTLILIKEKLGF